MKYALSLVLLLCLPGSRSSAAPGKEIKQEEAIRKPVADFAAAWNADDARAMAMMWTDDGDLVQPGGRMTRGRSEIEKRLAEEHSFFYKGSQFTSTVDSIRFIRPDVAVVDGAWQAVGVRAPNGKELPALKGLYTLVVSKKGGKWQAVSSRTMVPAAPPGGR